LSTRRRIWARLVSTCGAFSVGLFRDRKKDEVLVTRRLTMAGVALVIALLITALIADQLPRSFANPSPLATTIAKIGAGTVDDRRDWVAFTGRIETPTMRGESCNKGDCHHWTLNVISDPASGYAIVVRSERALGVSGDTVAVTGVLRAMPSEWTNWASENATGLAVWRELLEEGGGVPPPILWESLFVVVWLVALGVGLATFVPVVGFVPCRPNSPWIHDGRNLDRPISVRVSARMGQRLTWPGNLDRCLRDAEAKLTFAAGRDDPVVYAIRGNWGTFHIEIRPADVRELRRGEIVLAHDISSGIEIDAKPASVLHVAFASAATRDAVFDAMAAQGPTFAN
jgi:hypothetical protein